MQDLWQRGWHCVRALCGFLLYLCGFAPEDGLCKAARDGLWVCGRWQLQSGLVVAGKCLSSCWDYWEVPVARAGKGWMSHLVHTHSFTFLERGNQLTLAAQLFCELGAYWKDFNEYRRRGRHWDNKKFKKYQIKENLLHLPFTHTFPRCLKASPTSAAVGEGLGFLKPAESMETSPAGVTDCTDLSLKYLMASWSRKFCSSRKPCSKILRLCLNSMTVLV